MTEDEKFNEDGELESSSEDEAEDSEVEEEEDSEDDRPLRRRQNNRSSSSSSRNSPQRSHSQSSSPRRRQLVDDDSDDSAEEEVELASSPFSDFQIGTFCTVLPTPDATSVSREVRKLRKIKTQIWGAMQEKYGEQTGRIIMINKKELLVKLQFPEADLWFAYEALDITENQKVIRKAHEALRRAKAETPPDMHKRDGKINFGAAAANLAHRSLEVSS